MANKQPQNELSRAIARVSNAVEDTHSQLTCKVDFTEAFNMIANWILALASTTCLPWPNQLNEQQPVRYLSTNQQAQAGQTCYRTSTLPAHHILADKHDYNTYAGLLGAMLVEGAR